MHKPLCACSNGLDAWSASPLTLRFCRFAPPRLSYFAQAQIFLLLLYFRWRFRLYYYRSRLIRRLLLRARDPEALALDYF